MDINKLFKKVMSDKAVRDIPIFVVFTIMMSVMDAISSGECFYNTEFD